MKHSNTAVCDIPMHQKTGLFRKIDESRIDALKMKHLRTADKMKWDIVQKKKIRETGYTRNQQ